MASQQSLQPTRTTDRALQVCAMICAQTCRGGSTQLVPSRVTLPALRSTVKLDRPSRDFFTVSTIRSCKQRRPTLLSRKLILRYKGNHGCTTVPIPVSALWVSSCLQFGKLSKSTCANFQQTKISSQQWDMLSTGVWCLACVEGRGTER